MICDVCNAQTSEDKVIRVSPERFRQLLDQGFGIDETSVSMLIDAGMQRDAAIAALKAQHSLSQSFWMLCPECATQAERLL